MKFHSVLIVTLFLGCLADDDPQLPPSTTSIPFNVVDDFEINDSIHNLDEYLRALELKETERVQLKNSTVQEFSYATKFFEAGKENVKAGILCKACKIVIGVIVLEIRQFGESEKSISNRIGLLCPFFNAGTTAEACHGLLDRMFPTMYFVLKNRPELKVEAFCGFTLQQLGCNTDDPYLDWNVELKGIPKRVHTKLNFSEDPNREPRDSTPATYRDETARQSAEPVKILQLADLHIDLWYRPGDPADCKNNILCCRNESVSKPYQSSAIAGHFADNRKCDPPLSLLELTLQHLTETHKDIEYVYMTGDIVPHTIYNSNIRDNMEVIQKASALIAKYYPNTKVVSMVGNHEPHPTNLFSSPGAPAELDTRWLYNVSYESWQQWIPSDQISNYFKEGFYSVEISKTLKVLALNTNVCYGFNFWGMYDVKDPGDQLEWLIEELEKSEAQNQKVHIVGHVPPGHPDCNKVWSRNFYNIISRYHSTVKAQFYGHTHYDELKLFYSPTEAGVPINTLWISPSITPYELNNPSYKLFYADGANGDNSTWEIVDTETWMFDLEEANKTPDKAPEWFPLYRATSAYGIPDTTAESLGALVNKMAADKNLFDKFYQHFHKALPRQAQETSKFKQKEVLCGIVRPYFKNEKECERVQTAIDGNVESIPYLGWYK